MDVLSHKDKELVLNESEKLIILIDNSSGACSSS